MTVRVKCEDVPPSQGSQDHEQFKPMQKQEHSSQQQGSQDQEQFEPLQKQEYSFQENESPSTSGYLVPKSRLSMSSGGKNGGILSGIQVPSGVKGCFVDEC